MSQADHLFERALAHHREGRLAEASALYRQILQVRPRDSDALYLLGVVAHQMGDAARAVELLKRSLGIVPDQARCYPILGVDLMALGRLEEAEASFRRAIVLEKSAEAHNNLAGLYLEQGRFDEAAAACREALALDASYGPALCNLGSAWRSKGDLAQAAECFRKAVAVDDSNAAAVAALGQALLKLGRTEESVRYLQRAAALAPEDAGVHSELGDALQSQRKLDSALQAYRRAVELDPKLAKAWYGAGCAESFRQEYAPAMDCFRRALEAVPNWLEAQHNLGRALFKLGRVEEALKHFRSAAAMGNSPLPRGAIALVIPGDPESDNRAVLDARRSWAEAQLHPRSPASGPKREPAGDRRLRLGYVSSFFQDRNWMKPVWGLINQHDRERFEVHLFSDAAASRIEHGYRSDPRDTFHDVSKLSNADLAERIQSAGIDILVDLNGYSAMERLPMIALHPAPVVVGWFNMYATTGIASYDYLIGDEQAIPPEEEPFYCEKIARVPGSYLTFEVTYPVPPVAEPPCMARGGVTFGSLAPLYKITGQAIGVWSRILRQAPGSCMLIKNRELGSPGARQMVESMFAGHGIPADRLRLEGPAEHYKFLETYDAIDVALDTFPYNGGTTTTEAIWQGVPVATFRGDRWVSRTSASILIAGGLGELVAGGIDEYIELAVGLASSPERLGDLRRNMRARLLKSPVCDTAGFARNMERIFREMCLQGAAGNQE